MRGALACVDLETTGGNAAHNRIIEVGIVLVDDGRVVEEWSSLVNPGRRIPPSIAQFTGIDDSLVAGAPSFDDLRREIRGLLDGRLFVAHNARFDHGFLRSEYRRLEERFGPPMLCTVRLSRRLFPGERGHGLDALIERYGLHCNARHRALGDARVLPALLEAFVARVGKARVEETVRELLRAASLPPGLPTELAEELPETPGVYVFRGEGGAPLYVGKARNLRNRVLAHFAAEHRVAREGRLARQVRDVEWTETGGELGALLLESRLVKQLSPLTNRRLREQPAASVLRVRATGEGAGLVIEPLDVDALDAAAEAYGPFRDPRAARRALEGHARAAGLCLKLLGLESGAGSCFAHQLGGCRGACIGLEPRSRHDARLRLALARVRVRPWPFAGPVAIREPSSGTTGEVLHLIDRWRHLGSARTEEELYALADAPHNAGLDVDAYRIVSRWLGQIDPRDCRPLTRRGTPA